MKYRRQMFVLSILSRFREQQEFQTIKKWDAEKCWMYTRLILTCVCFSRIEGISVWNCSICGTEYRYCFCLWKRTAYRSGTLTSSVWFLGPPPPQHTREPLKYTIFFFSFSFPVRYTEYFCKQRSVSLVLDSGILGNSIMSREESRGPCWTDNAKSFDAIWREFMPFKIFSKSELYWNYRILGIQDDSVDTSSSENDSSSPFEIDLLNPR